MFIVEIKYIYWWYTYKLFFMSAIIWIHAVFIVYTLHIDKSNQVNEQSEQYNHHSGSRLNQLL